MEHKRGRSGLSEVSYHIHQGRKCHSVTLDPGKSHDLVSDHRWSETGVKEPKNPPSMQTEGYTNCWPSGTICWEQCFWEYWPLELPSSAVFATPIYEQVYRREQTLTKF